MLLARVYERMTNAAARSIPASTCFLSKREQMLAAELLRGQDIRFYGGPPMAEREICCYLPDYLDESWLESEDGPIAAVRIGRIDGAWVINPTHEQRLKSDLDLMYAGTRDRFLMMEGGADEIADEDFLAAMKAAK